MVWALRGCVPGSVPACAAGVRKRTPLKRTKGATETSPAKQVVVHGQRSGGSGRQDAVCQNIGVVKSLLRRCCCALNGPLHSAFSLIAEAIRDKQQQAARNAPFPGPGPTK